MECRHSLPAAPLFIIRTERKLFLFFPCDPPPSSGNVTRTGWMEKKSCVSLYTTKSTNSYRERDGRGPSVVLCPCKASSSSTRPARGKSPTVYNKQSLAPSPPWWEIVMGPVVLECGRKEGAGEEKKMTRFLCVCVWVYSWGDVNIIICYTRRRRPDEEKSV